MKDLQKLIVKSVVTAEELNANEKVKRNDYKAGTTHLRVECVNFQRGETQLGGLAKAWGAKQTPVSAFKVLPTEFVQFLGVKEGDDLNAPEFQEKIGNPVAIKVTEVTATEFAEKLSADEKLSYQLKQRYKDDSKTELVPLTSGGQNIYWKREVVDAVSEVKNRLLPTDKVETKEFEGTV